MSSSSDDDSEERYCHCCRSRKKNYVVCRTRSSHIWCETCVLIRLRLDFEEVKKTLHNWLCPLCMGNCPCSKHRRKQAAAEPAVGAEAAKELIQKRESGNLSSFGTASDGKIWGAGRSLFKGPVGTRKERERNAASNANKAQDTREGGLKKRTSEEEQGARKKGKKDCNSGVACTDSGALDWLNQNSKMVQVDSKKPGSVTALGSVMARVGEYRLKARLYGNKAGDLALCPEPSSDGKCFWTLKSQKYCYDIQGHIVRVYFAPYEEQNVEAAGSKDQAKSICSCGDQSHQMIIYIYEPVANIVAHIEASAKVSRKGSEEASKREGVQSFVPTSKMMKSNASDGNRTQEPTPGGGAASIPVVFNPWVRGVVGQQPSCIPHTGMEFFPGVQQTMAFNGAVGPYPQAFAGWGQSPYIMSGLHGHPQVMSPYIRGAANPYQLMAGNWYQQPTAGSHQTLPTTDAEKTT